MEEKLTKLYNTLSLIETKGENTVVMADCLRYVNQMIVEAGKQVAVEENVVEGE